MIVFPRLYLPRWFHRASVADFVEDRFGSPVPECYPVELSFALKAREPEFSRCHRQKVYSPRPRPGRGYRTLFYDGGQIWLKRARKC